MNEAQIRLLGACRTIPATDAGADAVEQFYGQLIPRLLNELGHGGQPSRLVGFRTMTNDGCPWQFLGLEVGCLGMVPDGMIGLALGDRSGEIVEQEGTRTPFPLTWLWADTTGRFRVGEFEAAIPRHAPECRPFSMTTNARVGTDGALSAEDAVELVDYDASWPDQFNDMARWLRGVLPASAGRLVHYGSTSVPGMSAKPVIDILVETPTFEEARRCLIPALNGDTWEYWWYADHMIFIKRERLNGPRTHHVHIAPPGHRLWEGLAFRDYLVAHPETAREYAALKQHLASRFRTEREKYTEAKTAFIRMITDKALSGQVMAARSADGAN